MKFDAIDKVLGFIQTNSIRNVAFKGMPPIDWGYWHESIHSYRQSSQPQDDLNIIQHALDALNDGHSGILNGQASNASSHKTPLPMGTMIGKTAYIRLPPCDRTSVDDDSYTKATQGILKQFDQSPLDGWIVDLRINTGGDYNPMLEGIGPLLGNGTHAYLAYPHLNIERPCDVYTSHPLKQAGKPIAVLTGDRTISSGEFILINFLKLKNNKIFGEPTAGCSSSNIDFQFNDRIVAITAGLMADRDKVPYGDKIHPDVIFENGARPDEIRSERYNPSTDPLVLHASKWIQRAAAPRPTASPAPSAP